MKNTIHPDYNSKAQITCACGAEFEIGSTNEKMEVELCAKCHPFYTGKQKMVDTARRVERFEARMKKSAKMKDGEKEESQAKDDGKEEEKKQPTAKANVEALKKAKDAVTSSKKEA